MNKEYYYKNFIKEIKSDIARLEQKCDFPDEYTLSDIRLELEDLEVKISRWQLHIDEIPQIKSYQEETQNFIKKEIEEVARPDHLIDSQAEELSNKIGKSIS